jgi:hypothetical protein
LKLWLTHVTRINSACLKLKPRCNDCSRIFGNLRLTFIFMTLEGTLWAANRSFNVVSHNSRDLSVFSHLERLNHEGARVRDAQVQPLLVASLQAQQTMLDSSTSSCNAAFQHLVDF